jgi:ubiquinone/menaquinone biosynthesis C-methylase UbiE/tetratricopeptide (TPR) repeat protein
MKKTITAGLVFASVFGLTFVLIAQTEARHPHGGAPANQGVLDISKTEFELRMEKQQPMDQIMKAIGVKKGMVIGEVGAGRGRVTMEMAKEVGPTGKIYANDIRQGELDILVERCKKAGLNNVETIIGKEDDPLLPEKSLDLVILNWVIHEVQEPEKLLSKIMPSLKPGAAVVIIEGNEKERVDMLKAFGFSENNMPKERMITVPVRNDEELKKMGREGGFQGDLPKGLKSIKIVLNPREEDVKNWAKESGFEIVKTEYFLPKDIIYILKATAAQKTSPEFPKLAGPYFGQKLKSYLPEPFLPGLISSNGIPKHSPLAVAPDGTEIYWAIAGPMTIYFSKVENGQWTKPAPAPFAQGRECASVAFYPDGSKIYFSEQVFERQPKQGEEHGNRGQRSIRLLYVEKNDRGWSEPKEADPVINTGDIGDQVSFAKNGTIYFSSGDRTVPREQQNGDIYYSRIVDGKYQKPVRLGDTVNSKLDENSVSISPEEAYLLFTRYKRAEIRPDKIETDFYISYRKKDGSWTEAREVSYLMGELATGFWIGHSPDGKYIFYTSRAWTRYTDIYWSDAGLAEFYKPNDLIVPGKLEDAVAKYKEWQKDNPRSQNIAESRFNSSGYALLSQNMIVEAIDVFKLNAALYPKSSNAFNSLGEAYARAGQKEKAIENYEISIQLNPDNKSSRDALAAWKGKK